ncbi:hypothetical protein FRB90_002835 [Tulasnella sp. 427]|nr:hypothetical protein FRB90_002835 [Tulasnella sp. 427]
MRWVAYHGFAKRAKERVKLDPVPWVPAVAQHTAEGASDEDEAYMVRAVETGIVNFSLAIQESKEKAERKKLRVGKGKEVV